jgi:catechol 2,3-dioxygenase-like lactoylglutathione lyase family enzyme
VSSEPAAGAVIYAKDMERVAAFYSTVLGLPVVERDDEHVRLESPALQLVVLRMPTDLAATVTITEPPARRANAAIKPVFFVAGIADLRRTVGAMGGAMNGAELEWEFDGWTVCDGLDPEGNVIQFRARAGWPARG